MKVTQILGISNFVSPAIFKDPFGDVIKGIMNGIHTHAQLNPLCQPGTQNYEQWVVQTEQNGKRETFLCSRPPGHVNFRDNVSLLRTNSQVIAKSAVAPLHCKTH